MLREALFLVVLCLVAWISFDALEGQRDEARRERDSAKWEASGLREAARISGEILAERDAIDQRNTKELTDVRTENERLRRAVGDGTGRLYVSATCPASGSVSATAGTARVADAGRAELAADARQDYFTLRDQLAQSRQMIVGLQQYALDVCRRSPALSTNPLPNLNK